MDVGHNEEAIGQLLKTLRSRYSQNSFIFVFGTSKKKPAFKMVQMVRKFLHNPDTRGELYLVNGNNERSKPVEDILKEIEWTNDMKVIEDGNIAKTLYHIVMENGEQTPEKVFVIFRSWWCAVRFLLWKKVDPFLRWMKKGINCL